MKPSSWAALVVCLCLVACGTAPAPARPGCDRNGDYEQRVAC